MELIRRLDTQSLRKGWQTLHLENPSHINCGYYGVFPLGSVSYSEEQELFEFLVFGGSDGWNLLDRTLILRPLYPT